MVTVFFRYDDFSDSSSWEVDRGLVATLQRHGSCATFGVIPAVTEGRYHDNTDRSNRPLGPERMAFLHQAIESGAVDVALHGWNHRTLAAAEPHTEFVGLSLEQQTSRIRMGRELLRDSLGIEASVFVPPWNSYDQHTVQALIDQGFTVMSANRYGPCLTGALRYIPITADVSELREAVSAARKSGDADPIVGVLLHPYDFRESGDRRATVDCESFGEKLEWLKQQRDVRVCSVSALGRENQSMDVSRYRANQPWPFEPILPSFVPASRATPFFRTTVNAKRLKALQIVAIALMYAGAVGLGSTIDDVATTISPFYGAALLPAVRLIAAALLIALIGRVVMKRRVYFRTMLAITILSGVVFSSLSLR